MLWTLQALVTQLTTVIGECQSCISEISVGLLLLGGTCSEILIVIYICILTCQQHSMIVYILLVLLHPKYIISMMCVYKVGISPIDDILSLLYLAFQRYVNGTARHVLQRVTVDYVGQHVILLAHTPYADLLPSLALLSGDSLTSWVSTSHYFLLSSASGPLLIIRCCKRQAFAFELILLSLIFYCRQQVPSFHFCFSWNPVLNFIDTKFEEYLNAESKVNRKTSSDNRVQCCLYFIAPTGHRYVCRLRLYDLVASNVKGIVSFCCVYIGCVGPLIFYCYSTRIKIYLLQRIIIHHRQLVDS